jgi:hypothetical protein
MKKYAFSFIAALSLVSATQTFELKKGWNLIGINEIAPNMEVRNIINSHVKLILQQFGNGWLQYNPAISYLQNFSSFQVGKGYWVKVDSDTNLTLNGIARENIPELKAGWNLVAISTNKTVNEQINDFTNNGYKIDLILQQFGNGWLQYNPAISYLQNFNTFDKNKGYWVKAEKLAAVATTKDGYDIKLYVDKENINVSSLAGIIPNYKLDELPNIANQFSNISNIVVSGVNNGQVVESSYINPHDSSFSNALRNAKNEIDNGVTATGGASLYVYGLSEGGSPFIISEAKVYKVNPDGTKGEYIGTTSQTGYLYLENVPADGEKVWVEKDGFFYSVQTLSLIHI